MAANGVDYKNAISACESPLHDNFKMGNSESTSDPDAPPWFTHGLESPPFTTLAVKDGYEIRKYKPSKWVGTEVESHSCTDAANTSFWRLFKYISGENEARQKIPMTCPVLVKIPQTNPGSGRTTFITHFYLPLEYQDKPDSEIPRPNNAAVALYNYPEFTAYVISYGGYNSDTKMSENSDQLETLLKRDGVEYKKEYSFLAGYDPPYRLFNRHNEVWFMSEGVSDQQGQETTEETVEEGKPENETQEGTKEEGDKEKEKVVETE